MANENRISVVITADASGAITGIRMAGDATEGLQKRTQTTVEKIKANWKELTAAAIGAYLAFEKVWGYAEKAASFQESMSALNALLAQYNMGATEMVALIERNSRGLIDQATAARIAGDALMKGLGPDQIAQIAKWAVTIEHIRGGTTKASEAMEMLAGSIATGRERGLKALIGIVDLNEKYGEYADVMSKAEKAQAMYAVAAERMSQVEATLGQETDSLADKMHRFETQIANIKLTIGDIVIRVGAGLMATFQSVSALALGLTRVVMAPITALMLATDCLGITKGKAQEYGQAMEALGDAAVYTAQQANDNFILMRKGFQEAAVEAGKPLPTVGDKGSRKRYEKLQELHRKYLEERDLANTREEDREFIRLNKWYDDQVKVLNDLHASKQYYAELWAAYSAKWDEAEIQKYGKIASRQIEVAKKMEEEERALYEQRLDHGEKYVTQVIENEQKLLEIRYKLSEATRGFDIDEEDVIRRKYEAEIAILEKRKEVLLAKAEEAKTERELLGIIDQVALTMDKIKATREYMGYEIRLTQTMDYRYVKALSRGEDENAIKILNYGLAKQKQLVEEAQAKVQGYLALWNYAYATQKTYIADLYNVTVSAFQGMENAITDFVLTGKANFTDFANSVIRDLMRIAVRAAIVQPLAQGLLGMFGSGASTSSSINLSSEKYQLGGSYKFGGYGASGIDTQPGYAYVVGEQGPEVFLPTTSGKVMPSTGRGDVKVQIINQSGAPMEIKDSKATFDPQEMIVTLWIDAANRNRFGLRTLLQGA